MAIIVCCVFDQDSVWHICWEIWKYENLSEIVLVFPVSGALYEASYETTFALALFDSPISENKVKKTDVKKVPDEASYKAPLIRKTRLEPHLDNSL